MLFKKPLPVRAHLPRRRPRGHQRGKLLQVLCLIQKFPAAHQQRKRELCGHHAELSFGAEGLHEHRLKGRRVHKAAQVRQHAVFRKAFGGQPIQDQHIRPLAVQKLGVQGADRVLRRLAGALGQRDLQVHIHLRVLPVILPHRQAQHLVVLQAPHPQGRCGLAGHRAVELVTVKRPAAAALQQHHDALPAEHLQPLHAHGGVAEGKRPALQQHLGQVPPKGNLAQAGAVQKIQFPVQRRHAEHLFRKQPGAVHGFAGGPGLNIHRLAALCMIPHVQGVAAHGRPVHVAQVGDQVALSVADLRALSQADCRAISHLKNRVVNVDPLCAQGLQLD